jgi:hypothetical protein
VAAPSTVKAGLKSRAETITGITGYDRPGGTLNLPAVLILSGPIVFDETMGRGSDTLTFDALLLVAEPTLELAAEDLDPYLSGSGASSLKAALEDDTTPITGVDYVLVPQVTQYGDVEYAGKQYLGARFSVEVNCDGTT